MINNKRFIINYNDIDIYSWINNRPGATLHIYSWIIYELIRCFGGCPRVFLMEESDIFWSPFFGRFWSTFSRHFWDHFWGSKKINFAIENCPKNGLQNEWKKCSENDQKSGSKKMIKKCRIPTIRNALGCPADKTFTYWHKFTRRQNLQWRLKHNSISNYCVP